MSVEPGHFALTLALMLTLLVAIGTPLGLPWRTVRVAVVLQAILLAVAFLFLVFSFAVSDFSVALVAAHSHSAKPLLYKIAAAWGNHEGSLLLWTLALGLCGVAALRLPPSLQRPVLAVHCGLGALFILFLLLASNPFARVDTSLFEGEGLNPVLQHPALAFHPPVLYSGYAALAVVFSLGIAALLAGEKKTPWVSWVRPWLLFAYACITAGIALGSWWAYHELGWGGFWFWDPVENASLLPWLATTALLHTAAVTARRGDFAVWTIFLSLCGLILALFGTFLVRSGALISVHAFAEDPRRGLLILGMVGVVALSSLFLFALRAPLLLRRTLVPPMSREGALALNNLLFVAAAVSVLTGTLYPLVVEALGGDQLSVGPPYFAATFMPMFAVLVFLIPFGPFLPWGRSDVHGAARQLFVPVGIAVFALIILFASVSQMTAIAGLTLGVWCLSGAVRDLVRSPLMSPPSGRALAHAGVGILMLGITGSTLLQREYNGALSPGERVFVWDGKYQATLEAVEEVYGPNYRAFRAQIVVHGGGRRLARLFPETRFYSAPRAATTEADVRALPLAHIYAILGAPRADGRWSVRLYYNPLTSFLWGGAALMILGGLLVLFTRRAAPVLGILAVCLALGAWVNAWPSSAQLLHQDKPLADPVLEAQAREIFGQLRCVVCQSQALAESPAPMAQDLRLLVRQKLLDGEKPSAILAHVTTLYGDAVLLRPPLKPATVLLWGAPFLALIGGGLFLARRTWRSPKA